MRKKTVFLLCIAIVLLGVVTGIFYDSPSSKLTNDAQSENSHDKAPIVEISVLELEENAKRNRNGITQQEAEELCRAVLGEQDKENGFIISYRCIGAVSSGEKQYYVMHIAWFVEQQHWSYIGNCYVSSDGQEIYDGVASNESHEITDLRWKNE